MLDASALLALLQEEPGAERVAEALPAAAISSVNRGEVVGKLVDKHVPADVIGNALDGLDLDVQPFERSQAFAAGELRSQTAAHGLSLGDRT